MTEFRRDPLTHRWIVTGFAEGDKEEDLLLPLQSGNGEKECHFCEGKEYLTPPETYSVRKKDSQPNGPGWETRVVPNRSTNIHLEELNKKGIGGLYDMQNASGIHETVIETPEHLVHFSQLSADQMATVLKTLQQRVSEHKKNHILKGVLIYRNQGKGSAGIFRHTHSQIISLPFVPKTISDELEGARRHFELKTRCIFCDMIREEKKMKVRIVSENSRYFCWCPFASRFPFETWILPKEHASEFPSANPDYFSDCAGILKAVLTRMEGFLGDAPITFILHTAPLRESDPDDLTANFQAYHWHIEILPHAWPVGGYEWGGDSYLSPPSPETCAKILRSGK